MLSTAELTAYFPHPKRTAEALEAFGLLEQFVSVLVHNHWSAYARYQCLHAFCNAHHLQRANQPLPRRSRVSNGLTDMSALLCEANVQVNAARAQGWPCCPRVQWSACRTATTLSSPPPKPLTRAVPGVPAPAGASSNPPYNLIARLREHRDEVLRFITDLRVSFDNNQAERDLRMPKLKQKAPACFRSETGGEAFAVIRSSLSTLRKQSANLFQSLVPTFPGNPPMPRLG